MDGDSAESSIPSASTGKSAISSKADGRPRSSPRRDRSIGEHGWWRWHRRPCLWKRCSGTRQDARPLTGGAFTAGLAVAVALLALDAFPILSAPLGRGNAIADDGCPRRFLRAPRRMLDLDPGAGFGDGLGSIPIPIVCRRLRLRLRRRWRERDTFRENR
jgi:hypothetical protein